MSPAGRFPDDPKLPDPQLRVERILESHKPRPVSFDAEAILKVALDPDAAGERGTLEFARGTNWIVLGASWISGALAGALVTALWMASPAVPAVAVDADPVSHIASPRDVVANKDEDTGIETRIPAPRDEQRAPIPRWSATDNVVANRIMNLSHSTPGGMILQAGSYVRLSSPEGAWLVPGSPVVRQGEGDHVVPPDRDTEIERASPSSLDREQLLQELLGDGTTSTL